MAISDYTDAATLKGLIGIDAADTSQDTRLAQLITAASRSIDRYCGRHFYSVVEPRYFQADDPVMPINPFSERRLSGLLKLPVDDLLSLTELVTDYDGDRIYETTWDPAWDYFLEPANAPSFLKPYTQIRVDWIRGRYRLPPWPRSIRVTGTWGYWTAVPDMVRESCLRMAERVYKLPDAPLGVLPNAAYDRLGESMTERLRSDPDLAGWLQPYVREWVLI
jgi:hypothetical protein